MNITNGPKGLMQIDSVKLFGIDFGRPLDLGWIRIESVSLYYYLFLFLVVFLVCCGLALYVTGCSVTRVRVSVHTDCYLVAVGCDGQHPSPQKEKQYIRLYIPVV